MKKTNARDDERTAFHQARSAAAAAFPWPQKATCVILVNPDPVVRKKARHLAIRLGVIVMAWMILADPHGPLANWAHDRDNSAVRPAMESAMKDGNRAAGTWLATHYWKDYPGLLREEAKAGDPTAMFVMGRALMLDAHADRYLPVGKMLTPEQVHEQGLSLVRKAAAAGSQDALTFAATHGGM
jgi:hypothetical protein